MKQLSGFSVVILAIIAAATSGCGPALHPFFTSSDLYEDPALEGRWTNGEDTWEFHRTGDGRYSITECSPECKDSVSAAMFRIDGQVFLDIQEPKNGFSSAILPHGVIRLRIKADQVEVASIDEKALRVLSHVLIDNDRMLVTASTARLQQFLSRHAGDPQVWNDSETYRRATDLP